MRGGILFMVQLQGGGQRAAVKNRVPQAHGDALGGFALLDGDDVLLKFLAGRAVGHGLPHAVIVDQRQGRAAQQRKDQNDGNCHHQRPFHLFFLPIGANGVQHRPAAQVRRFRKRAREIQGFILLLHTVSSFLNCTLALWMRPTTVVWGTRSARAISA